MIHIVLVALLAASTPILPAPEKGKPRIAPGARAISPQEAALAADPANGSLSGIIITSETNHDDDFAEWSMIGHHFRALILNNEARDLADVELPFDAGLGTLKNWWGFIVCPNEPVRELAKDLLQEQMVARRVGGNRYSVLKGAIPGASPGCIIDYGYTFSERGHRRLLRVDLQSNKPIQKFRYHWSPMGLIPSAFRASRTEPLPIRITRTDSAVDIVGRDLPAVLHEPHGPPEKEVRASATFYYTSKKHSHDGYWDEFAASEDRAASSFAKDGPIRQAIAAMAIPEGADLDAKLRIAYDWIGATLKNRSTMAAEEMESAGSADSEADPSRQSAKEVLASGEATSLQIDYFMLGVARALGAEAWLVFSTDRTDHYFDPGIMSSIQFNHVFVAVMNPGRPDEEAVFLDAGSGLPYGNVSWWATGTRSLLSARKGARMPVLWPGEARDSISYTQARIVFDPDGSAKATFQRSGTGQHGFLEKQALRLMGVEDRERALNDACGSGGYFDVSRAEAPGIEALAGGHALECDGVLSGMAISEGDAGFVLDLRGPWLEPIPELLSETRTHPVIFDFPRIDRTLLEIDSPVGFIPKLAPAPVKVESPFGRYDLAIAVTTSGYRVERIFALTALGAEVKDYLQLRTFLEAVRKADATPLEFSRRAETP